MKSIVRHYKLINGNLTFVEFETFTYSEEKSPQPDAFERLLFRERHERELWQLRRDQDDFENLADAAQEGGAA